MSKFKIIEKSRFLDEGEMSGVEGGDPIQVCIPNHGSLCSATRYSIIGPCTGLNYESCGIVGTYRNCGDVVPYSSCNSGGIFTYVIPHL